MASHRVEISVSNGNIDYSLDPILANAGDSIEWVCSAGAFAVHLGWGTPCGKGRLRAGQGKSANTSVRTDAPNGRFKYMVAVNVGGEIYTDDPEIVVRPKG